MPLPLVHCVLVSFATVVKVVEFVVCFVLRRSIRVGSYCLLVVVLSFSFVLTCGLSLRYELVNPFSTGTRFYVYFIYSL